MSLEEQVKQVITEKGSVYTYLPDGRTQRFKKATGEICEPQDLLIFIPPFAWVAQHAPAPVRRFIGETEQEYQQTMLSYLHAQGRKIRVHDERGVPVDTNAQARQQRPFLYFISNGTVDYTLPVAILPRIGFQTYDTRRYNDNGKSMRERHIGNKIVDIIYASPNGAHHAHR